MRRWGISLLACLGALASLAPAADAARFKGATAAWGDLEATITNGSLVAFKTKTSRLRSCPGGQEGVSGDPFDLVYRGPGVPLVAGKFHLEGTSQDNGGSYTWSADGTQSPDGKGISGTITATGGRTPERTCTGSWTFDAIDPPGRAVRAANPTFDNGTGSGGYNPRVSFNYKNGLITRLDAGVGTECPTGASYHAQFNSAGSRLDPVRTKPNGSFRVAGAVLDHRGVVTHFVINGRVRGKRASGTMRSTRPNEINGRKETCSRTARWTAKAETPISTTAPRAFFEVDAYRFGRTGAFSYYLVIKLNGCAHANRARVSIGSIARTVGCRGSAKLGPLTPKRYYDVRVLPVRTRGKRTLRRGTPVRTRQYLPGDDGVWIRD